MTIYFAVLLALLSWDGLKRLYPAIERFAKRLSWMNRRLYLRPPASGQFTLLLDLSTKASRAKEKQERIEWEIEMGFRNA